MGYYLIPFFLIFTSFKIDVMITITPTIASDFKSISLVIDDDGIGANYSTLDVFMGDDYLVPTPINLDSMVSGLSGPQTITILNTDLLLGADEEIIGLVFFHITNSLSDEKEQYLFNKYYIDLALAKMIITYPPPRYFEDVNTVYLLLNAISIYLATPRYEDALNAYNRVVAMVKDTTEYLSDVDIDPPSAGSGEWINNGTYIQG